MSIKPQNKQENEQIPPKFNSIELPKTNKETFENRKVQQDDILLQNQEMRKNLMQQKMMSKQYFQDANKEFAKLFMLANREKKEQYLQGKEDAYAEILKYLLGNHRDLKHIPFTQFLTHINTKLIEIRTGQSSPQQSTAFQKIAQKTQQARPPPATFESSEIPCNSGNPTSGGHVSGNSSNLQWGQNQQNNLVGGISRPQSEITYQNQNSIFFENSNRNRQLQQTDKSGANSKKSIGMTSLNQDFKQIAINALANQCERDQNSPIKIITKIKGDISAIRISESKKRLRPSCYGDQAAPKDNLDKLKKIKPDVDANGALSVSKAGICDKSAAELKLKLFKFDKGQNSCLAKGDNNNLPQKIEQNGRVFHLGTQFHPPKTENN